jgi:hypothetical protein
MANLTAAKNYRRQPGELVAYKLNNIKVFTGALLAVNSSGYAVKANDAAVEAVIGVAESTVDNSTGSAGDKTVDVWQSGVFDFAFSGTATQADVGKKVYAVDDQTVALAATTTNDNLVGRIVEFISASKVRVRISPEV